MTGKKPQSGRNRRYQSTAEHGRRSPGPGSASGWIDWIGSLKHARATVRGYSLERLRYKPYRRPGQSLWLFLLDLSGSTLSHSGLVLAKGLINGMARLAYQNRAQLAIMGFQGEGCRTVYGPKRPDKNFRRYLNQMRGGGATPLRGGLQSARQFVELHRQLKRFHSIELILISDGRTTDPMDGITMPCTTMVIDIDSAPVPLGRCRQIADQLGARYIHISEIPTMELI